MASSERGFQELGNSPRHKDKYDQRTEDGVALASLFDQGELSDVDEVKQYLACSSDPATCTSVNRTNSEGQTPLMIACRNLKKDKARSFLEAGADPNLTCEVHGNSALHYACQGDKDLIFKCRKKKKCLTQELQIIEIVEVLIHHGATLKMNKDGLSPACVAALNSFKSVVSVFASSSDVTMPPADKVKAYELLGVSQAVFDDHHAIDACESFHLAASLHSKDDSDVTPHHVNSDLDAWFCDMMKKRKLTTIEKHIIRQKAFTIGIKCIPDKIKDKYNFWNFTSKYTDPALFDGRATEEGYDLLVSMIKKEMREDFPLGTVMNMMKAASESTLRNSGSSGMEFIPNVLEIYAEIFREDYRQLGGKRHVIHKLLGDLLFILAYKQSEAKYLEHSLPFVEGIINCLKMYTEEPSPISDDHTLSVTSVFYNNMFNAMSEDNLLVTHNLFSINNKLARDKLKFVIFRLLSYNGFDPNSDKSLLKDLVKHFASACSSFLLPLAAVLIRHGCPTKDVSIDQNDIAHGGPDVIELQSLLSPATTPHSLMELTARAVLRNNLPYRERLPVKLSKKIDVEMYLKPAPSDLDL